MQNRFVPAAALAAVAVTLSTSSALAWDPQFAQFYVGIDGRNTLNSGTYSTLANPNHNRLTFLLGHSYVDAPTVNHYHNKSAYSYTGTNLGTSTAVNPRPANNFLPETGYSPAKIQLLPGTGDYAGKFRNGLTAEATIFDRMTIGSTDELLSIGTGGSAMYYSGTGTSSDGSVDDPDGTGPLGFARYGKSMAGVNLVIEVLSITPGLNVGIAGNATVLDSAGDQYAIGLAGAALDFTPILFTENTTGDYSVTFKLLDTGTSNGGNAFGESGQFTFNATVPEPASLALLGLSGLGLMRRRRS